MLHPGQGIEKLDLGSLAVPCTVVTPRLYASIRRAVTVSAGGCKGHLDPEALLDIQPRVRPRPNPPVYGGDSVIVESHTGYAEIPGDDLLDSLNF